MSSSLNQSANSKISFYTTLIFATLAVSLLVKLIIFTYFNGYYFYDEIITTEISKQPLKLMLETVTSEPHPPGFYLFLKLFPVTDVLTTRILLLVFFYVSLLAILSYGYRSGVIRRYRMELGLVLFICSVPFAYISTFAKQDMLSFLLFLLTLFFLLNYWDSSQPQALIGAVCVIILQFFVGYIYFIFSVGMVLTTVIFIEKNNLRPFTRYWYLPFFGLPILIYLWSYFPLQLQDNLHRFKWMGDETNGIFIWLKTTLIPVDNSIVEIYDLMIIVFLFMLFSAIKARIQPGVKVVKDPLLVFLILGVLLSFFLGWFKVPRYSAATFFLMLLIIGAHLQKYLERKYNMYLLVMVLIWLQAISMALLYNNFFWEGRLRTAVSQAFTDLPQSEKMHTGLVIRHPISAFVFKKNLPKDITLFPISPVVNYTWEPEEINRKLLLRDGTAINMSVEECAESIQKRGITSYLYLFFDSDSYYDPGFTLFTALATICDIGKVYELDQSQLILFTNCRQTG